jgi:hypothetical protein
MLDVIKRFTTGAALVHLTSRMRLPNFVEPSDRLITTTSPISKAVPSANK